MTSVTYRSAIVACAVAAAQPAVAEEVYFPPDFAKPSLICSEGGETYHMKILDSLQNTWYSSHLAAAEEPSLYLAALKPRRADTATLRFTWLRTFDAPVVIRIETSGPGTHQLIVKQLSGAGGYKPGKVVKSLDRTLTIEEASEFEAMMARTRVLSLPPRECEGLGLDGAQWLIEGVDRSGYHFVDRWTPKTGKVREVGDFLLKLAGWDFEPIY
jgi:hypothetical protein